MDVSKKIDKLLEEEKYQDVIKLLENQIESLDYNSTCNLALAYCNMAFKNKDVSEYNEKALSLLLSIEDKGKNDPTWYYGLGFVYYNKEDIDKALYYFKQAVELITVAKKNDKNWDKYNLATLFSTCENTLKIKKMYEKLDANEDIEEQDITDFILFCLLHNIFPVDDIITDNSIHIPEWMLIIRPLIIYFEDDTIEIEWNIVCPLFTGILQEVTFGSGDNLKYAIFNAVGVFQNFFLHTIQNVMQKKSNTSSYISTYNDYIHKWDVYYSKPVLLKSKTKPKNLNSRVLWSKISPVIKNYLGNQKTVYIKFLVTKYESDIVSECYVDNIYMSDLSDAIGDIIEDIVGISENVYTFRQHIILLQHENTILPYKYEGQEGYISLKNKVKKVCNIVGELKSFNEEETEEDMNSAFEYLITRINDEIKDFTLSIETLIFIPEILVEYAYHNIFIPDKTIVHMQNEESREIYFTQFYDYGLIYKAVWEVFENYEDKEKLTDIYNKFISMSFSLNNAYQEGIMLDKLQEYDEILVPVFEINVDDKFEIR